MSNIIFFICLLLSATISFGQNVGIGVANPGVKLDVAGTFRLRNLNANSTAGIYLDGTTLPLRSFIGTYDANHFGLFGNGGAGWDFLINNSNSNIGLGTIPSYRLDVNGRMRIRHNANTAGIWFDGTTSPTRSFIGTVSNDYVGFYGNGGAGWNFVMNTTNGKVGVGTTTPTQRLDVNGTMRIRSNSPVKGSVLTSKDINGNAEWVNPIAFRAEGTASSLYQSIPNGTWTKVLFDLTNSYDLGNGYQESLSEFHVPVSGVYSFTSMVYISSPSLGGESIARSYIRIRMNRNGIDSDLGLLVNDGFWFQNPGTGYNEYPRIMIEENLLAGDKVWVEVNITTNSGQPSKIGDYFQGTYFSGNLVAKI